MAILLAVTMVVHGLIHLLGFVKAMSPDAVPGLAASFTKPIGGLWLVAGVLWLTSGALVVVSPGRWWIPASAAVVLSQALLVGAWHDAKYGTVVNLVLLLPILVSFLTRGPLSERARFESGVRALTSADAPVNEIVTDADLFRLPAGVQRYLRYVGAVGRPRVHNFQVRFRGSMRDGPDAPWMPASVDQVSHVAPAARWFVMTATRAGIPFDALHVYEGEHATFRVRLAGLKTIIDARGPEMDQSETVTLFNDMCLLAPATLIDPAIQWETTGAQTVRARFRNAGHLIAADLTFSVDGALATFVSDDRFRLIHGNVFKRIRWSTPVMSYRAVDGRRLIRTAEARWGQPGDDFAYARLEVMGVSYNVSADSLRFAS